jgi:hypothetical protein
MKTKLLVTIIACVFITSAFSQVKLNNYKYVIVSKKFDFLKSENQYQLNELSQFLLNKYGFVALMEGTDYPDDLAKNRCLALDADVIKESGMFKTRLKVELTDCNDKLIYTSKIGESREKEYKVAYNEAIRDAFSSFKFLNYKYEPSAGSTEMLSAPSTEIEIEKLKEEIKTLKQEKSVEVVEEEIVAEAVPMVVTKEVGVAKVVPSRVLYAQAIANGFQLVDSSPKVLYRIQKTQMNDVFLVENKSAIIYKKANNWILEQYENGVLKSENLNIKF